MSGKKNRKKKRKRGRVAVFIVEMILLVALLGVLFVWSKYQRLDRGGDIGADAVNTDLDDTTREVLDGYTNIAIFGLDNRTSGVYSSGNSDAIMIASINNDTKEVRLVSVYRDTYLNVAAEADAGWEFRKANYAYNHGGAEAAVRMLNQNLDLDIKDYVAVDFYALSEVVDLLGGIELDIEEGKMMEEINVYIAETAAITGREAHMIDHAGVQTVDGVQATAYCRIRHDVNDFRRAQRQREVISRIIEKTKASDLLTINKIVDTALADISTDFTAQQLVALASHLLSYKLTQTAGFPFALYTFDQSRKYIVVPCDLAANVKQLHAYLFDEEDYTPSQTVLNISDAIYQDTGKTVGDETATGVEADADTDHADSSGVETE